MELIGKDKVSHVFKLFGFSCNNYYRYKKHTEEGVRPSFGNFRRLNELFRNDVFISPGEARCVQLSYRLAAFSERIKLSEKYVADNQNNVQTEI